MCMALWFVHKELQDRERALAALRAAGAGPDLSARTFPTLDGSPFSLSRSLGRKLVLRFWSSGCPVCQAGTGDFARLAERLALSAKADAVSVVSPGLSGERSAEDFRAWARSEAIPFPVVIDDEGALRRAFRVAHYPDYLLLDEDGLVEEKRSGDEAADFMLRRLA